MEIFKDDYVRLKTGKIGKVLNVVNIRYWNDKEIIKYSQDIYTDIRKEPFSLDDIEMASADRSQLDKRRKKVAN